MNDFDAYPGRIVTPATLSRGGAMYAGLQMIGGVEYANSSIAGGRPPRLEVLVGSAIKRCATELPAPADTLEILQEAWEAWAELHAHATGLLMEAADDELRKQFKRYWRLLTKTMKEWNRSCETGNAKLPIHNIEKLNAIIEGECGQDSTDHTEFLFRLHVEYCLIDACHWKQQQ